MCRLHLDFDAVYLPGLFCECNSLFTKFGRVWTLKNAAKFAEIILRQIGFGFITQTLQKSTTPASIRHSDENPRPRGKHRPAPRVKEEPQGDSIKAGFAWKLHM